MWSRRELLILPAVAGAHGVSESTQALKSESASSTTENAIKQYKLPNTDIHVSRIGYGCAQLGRGGDSTDTTAAAHLIQTACDAGITLFDHADIYYDGQSETVFGKILKQSPGLRHRVVIQSKCGIVSEGKPPLPPQSNALDLSYNHIVNAVDGSLGRLDTDYLDILLLHWPDALVEPDEVARAFDQLQRSGKVRCFGVSNHTSGQIGFLQKYVRQPIVINQIQMSLAYSDAVADGLDITEGGSAKVNGIMDYCRSHDVKIQAYSPLKGDFLNPPENAPANLRDTIDLLNDIAIKQNATLPAVMLAWLLRHPAGIVPIIGPTAPAHLIEDCAADRLVLSRDEWYALYIRAAKLQARTVA